MARLFYIEYLGGDKIRCTGQGRLTALHFAEGFANHLLGQAGTFTALTGNAEGRAHITVAAATFKDCVADLMVGDTFAETDIHGIRLVAGQWLVAFDTNANENACQSSCPRLTIDVGCSRPAVEERPGERPGPPLRKALGEAENRRV